MHSIMFDWGLGIALVFGLGSLSEGAVERHTPWKLDGAQERIEKYRMAAVNLEVHLPDGSLLPIGFAGGTGTSKTCVSIWGLFGW